MDIDIINQLINLKKHCEKNVRGKADTWYDDVKALEVAIEFLEKQLPKKPTTHMLGDYSTIRYCQRCDCGVSKQDNYCRVCGQKIDWSEQ